MPLRVKNETLWLPYSSVIAKFTTATRGSKIYYKPLTDKFLNDILNL